MASIRKRGHGTLTLIHKNDSGPRKRILVVEDEGIIACDIAAILRHLAFEVTGQAATASAALELCSSKPTDLVLMDIQIRGSKDGIETANEIRQTWKIPVVFLTAHADSETLRRANLSQPFGYVLKPFSETSLKVAIEVGFNRHRLQEAADQKGNELAPAWVPTSSEEQLQELSYALSNDLREPLRNISCFATLLERQSAGKLNSESREYLDFIVKGSKRIESQIGSLRTFYLAGTAPIEDLPSADATEICHQVLDCFSDRLREIQADVTLGPLPAVRMDARSLNEVYKQLIGNAIRFRSERTLRITIHAQRTDHCWTFCVGDNGLGFERGQSERIFHLFTKAHEVHTSGNGIGLAICRRTVEAAGGKIWAESVEGVGSNFFFILPGISIERSAA